MIRFPRSTSACREGFSLVEIVVAMLLLSVTLLALAALMSQVAQQGRATAVTSQRTAVLTHQVNYFTALSYDALTAGLTGCTTVTDAPLPHERCVQITGTGKSRTVKIRIAPAQRAYKPDSAVFNRTAAPENPFRTIL